MIRKIAITIAIAAVLSGCETPTTQRYAVSADNIVSIRALNTTGVGISTFKAPAGFSSNCRALGPMRVADGLTHAQYIQKAFEDEFKVAGAYATGTPRVTIGGDIQKIEFSSTRAITGGSWTIEVNLMSSNGKQLGVKEYYEFDSGFAAFEACRNTAEAFSRAVQDLVGKAVKNSEFMALLN